MPRIDWESRDEGTLILFRPISRAAKAWFAEKVDAAPWQWFGEWLCVDRRMAPQIAEGLAEDGLS